MADRAGIRLDVASIGYTVAPDGSSVMLRDLSPVQWGEAGLAFDRPIQWRAEVARPGEGD